MRAPLAARSLFGQPGEGPGAQRLGAPAALAKATGANLEMKAALDDATTGRKGKVAKLREDRGTFRRVAAWAPDMPCAEKDAGGGGKTDALFGEPGAGAPCQPVEFDCVFDGGKIDVNTSEDPARWRKELAAAPLPAACLHFIGMIAGPIVIVIVASEDSSVFEPGYNHASKSSATKDMGGPGVVSYIQTFALDAKCLHPAFYTDEAYAAAERERIFGTQWFAAAHVQELSSPGDVKLVFVQMPMVFPRKTNKIHALYNTCRHRGARVCSSSQKKCKQLVCPYHWWAYRLDGTLKATPPAHTPKERKENLGLLPVPGVGVFAGVVFLNQAPNPPPLLDTLGDLPEKLSNYDLGDMGLHRAIDYDIKGNWKLIAENFVDFYHISKVEDHMSYQGRGQYVGLCTAPLTDCGGPGDSHLFNHFPRLRKAESSAGLFSESRKQPWRALPELRADSLDRRWAWRARGGAGGATRGGPQGRSKTAAGSSASACACGCLFFGVLSGVSQHQLGHLPALRLQPDLLPWRGGRRDEGAADPPHGAQRQEGGGHANQYAQKCEDLWRFVRHVNEEDIGAIENLQRGLVQAGRADVLGEFLPEFDWPVHRFQNMSRKKASRKHICSEPRAEWTGAGPLQQRLLQRRPWCALRAGEGGPPRWPQTPARSSESIDSCVFFFP
ncbi:unnamed protein product [Prorocentrum cordatum]|uniref:Choline monooxygenase, chloroplastic n=1 Tax=Prorocentrum cordatum TaxID=2364126 RepID=A0ABN9QRY4_9DINO|nr:unnamed protein product [Polarella glacialis]